ncbi:hypothetical protein JCM10212_001948 [Sporobolomyces blumeae]
MLERPHLSISTRRRSSQLQVPSTASGPSSPLALSPVTPQTNAFFGPESYFPSFAPGPSTPPIAGNASLFPPPFPGRRGLLRRNSSLSSVSSSIGDDDDDLDREWTEAEEDTVRTMYDSCLAKHALTEAPFPSTGPPPSNFTNSVARQIIRAHSGPGRVTRSATRSRRSAAAAARLAAGGQASVSGGSSDAEENEVGSSEVEMDAPAPKWRHGLRATRLKILQLVKERQNAHLEATPRQCDPDATPKKRNPMVRQGSMDFLPAMDNTSTIARLGSMLRQPSNDAVPTTTLPTTAHPSRQFNRFRMQRTNSLSTIAGSPSQPKKAVDPNLLNPTPAPPSSHRMMRLGSDSSVTPVSTAPSMSRALSCTGRPRYPAVPPPPTGSGLAPSHAASALPSSITPKKKPAPLSFGEGFSNLHTPLNLSSKRGPSSSGLGSAFNSPVVGAYPTPNSLPRDGSKRKSWKKAKIDSSSASSGEEDKAMTGPGDDASQPPHFVNQAHAFALPTHPLADEALEFSARRRSRPSLSASSSSTTLCSTDSSMSDAPPPKLVLTPSLSPCSSFSSIPNEPATPSPLSATFNLNDLKLETLSADLAMQRDGADSDDADSDNERTGRRAGKTGLGFGFLDRAYVEAGHEAQALRERFGEFAWAIEQNNRA